MTLRNKRIIRDIDGSVHEIECFLKFDPKTYSIKNEYKLAGKSCPKITLKSPQALNFAAYALIKKDLKFVKKSFEYATTIASDEVDAVGDGLSVRYRAEIDTDADILKALFISAVITYGKCFTKADGRKVKLDFKNIFKGKGEEKKLHAELMELRHQYLAHGGKTNYEKTNAILVLHPTDKQTPPILMTECVHVSGFGKKDFEKFLSLISFVDSRVDEILAEKAVKLYQKDVSPVSIEDLHVKAAT